MKEHIRQAVKYDNIKDRNNKNNDDKTMIKPHPNQYKTINGLHDDYQMCF
ncbi:hypothetical protein ENT52713_29830 [Enterobacter sp. 200527-13]|nr:hypothetical protein ENT52713_29830 [Enterobacter sp. 200527-13]